MAAVSTPLDRSPPSIPLQEGSSPAAPPPAGYNLAGRGSDPVKIYPEYNYQGTSKSFSQVGEWTIPATQKSAKSIKVADGWRATLYGPGGYDLGYNYNAPNMTDKLEDKVRKVAVSFPGYNKPASPDAPIKIFADKNYVAATNSISFSKPGEWDLKNSGFPGNVASSIKVAPGWIADLYENADFTGYHYAYTTDSPNITSKLEDKAKSIRVSRIGSNYPAKDTDPVKIYEDPNYGGFNVGFSDTGDWVMISTGFPGNIISSIKVAPGWTADVYENADFTGYHYAYTTDSPNMTNKLEDKAAAIRITRTTAASPAPASDTAEVPPEEEPADNTLWIVLGVVGGFLALLCMLFIIMMAKPKPTVR
jgi:hypothetical protein